jgi:hypothetical protein
VLALSANPLAPQETNAKLAEGIPSLLPISDGLMPCDFGSLPRGWHTPI